MYDIDKKQKYEQEIKDNPMMDQ